MQSRAKKKKPSVKKSKCRHQCERPESPGKSNAKPEGPRLVT